uniref:Mitochondrial 2-oxoglutarate/malate carrier protein n=2 Tax=Mucochytrium quahogii TaxID=96639 RepID=A0A7S2WJZ8_9STRA|mmetsp:Transcript_4296/g.6353  ORF Transcript_4296/g.6353 Transcript_4296/m.6353 type:complete len:347 (-) Transcript_4296:2779-3819(-)|eukprot:CAMPEP_0203767132 /NCGR_PEP_ID=MMETSP0099_2-20121227/819_1 /ASSEMBLY_ACC=CAM_ASM_000209 /TAXON_ID=96639 /ORGANISM=" , Strain NY0313808BC1" /LENGTH=346 /DNA_ID=CAMNT_0050663591 /DNA_START=23 /DNA_END=1063 /DNA_ORIENTATION=-
MASVAQDTTATAEKLQPFVCGGLAACLASSCIHPIDLTKVRLQLAGENIKPGQAKPTTIGVIRNALATEGISGLYSGLSAALTRQATYGTARIGLHRTFSNYLVELNGGAEIPFWQKTLSGLSSGAIAVCIGTPFDVALVRMQADGTKPVAERRNYKNVFDALIRISKQEGVSGLWRGLAPNILRGMSMNVGMLTCYDEAKQMIVANVTHDADSLPTKLASSAVAGFCCAFLSLPFDMIKSRLQNMRADPKTGAVPYKGVVDCAGKILRNEGPLAFWTGFGAYYGRCAPHAMIILLSLESITKAYRETFGLEHNKHAMSAAARFTSTGTVNDYADGDDDEDEEFEN